MNFTAPELSMSFYKGAAPVLILAVSALLALTQAVFKRLRGTRAVAMVHYVALTAAFGASVVNLCANQSQFLGGSYLMDSITKLGSVFILAIALVTSILFSATKERVNFYRGEVVSLFHMLVVGMLIMMSAGEVVSVFIGLELASIGLYALIGYVRPNRRSLEGAVKYFILGSFASGFLLFGLALLYAATGSLVISTMVQNLVNVGTHPWAMLGGLLVMVGLGFKLALAPFHLWAPDAYEAAPTGITGFMATAVKVMTILVMLRFLSHGMPSMSHTWGPFLMFTAVLSTIFGNIFALVQSSIKRMLAYSSVAHAGYMAIALCAIGADQQTMPIASVLFYLISYSIVSLGTFGILMWLETGECDNLHIDDLSGLVHKHPRTAIALAVFLFSFAGIPPTAGFMGKFFVFSSALYQGLYGLVIIGLIGAMISLYYYLRLMVKMFMAKPIPAGMRLNDQKSWVVSGLVVAAIVLSIALGTVAPGPLMVSMKETTKAVLAR